MVEVLQIDREAAAEFAFSPDAFNLDPAMRERWQQVGEALPLVQAFARHRLATRASPSREPEDQIARLIQAFKRVAVYDEKYPDDTSWFDMSEVHTEYELRSIAIAAIAAIAPSREAGELREALKLTLAIVKLQNGNLHDDINTIIAQAEAALTLPEQPRPVEDVERMRSAIEQALHCTPSIRYTANVPSATIVYDCGDPWEILRAALGHKDRGGE